MVKLKDGFDEDLTAGGLSKARLEVLLQESQAVKVVFECRWVAGAFAGDYINDAVEEG